MERIIELLANSEDKKEKKLAKQLTKPDSFRARVYKKRLYLTALAHMDETSCKILLEIEDGLRKVEDHLIYNGGWFINRVEAYTQEYCDHLKAGNTDKIYHYNRDIDGFHLETTVPTTPYQKAVRMDEERYFEENKPYLKLAHKLMLAKDNILYNRLFTAKPGSEELVEAILNYFNFNKELSQPILPTTEEEPAVALK